MLKKIVLIIGKFLVGLIFFLFIYTGTAFVISRITVNANPDAAEDITIYILTNGVHTDIVMPVKTPQMDWSRKLKYGNTISADSTYEFIGVGWGDKTFYMETPNWSDLKASVAIKAASGLSASALHATYYRDLKEGEDCKKINISKEQYEGLITYVEDSFDKDENGQFIHIPSDANYGISDTFYEARGSLSIFNTCNTWVNSALKAADQRACLWTISKDGIFSKYED